MKYKTKAAKALETIDLKLEIDAMNDKVKLKMEPMSSFSN
jgi:hypothetical protein